MATYAIGDVHGCGRTLKALVEKLPFYPHADRLWMVGDLVNRGPDNVGVVTWARNLERLMGARFQAVLGNHDLHLLARGAGLREGKENDTVEDVLGSPERDELLSWLRRRPLAVAAEVAGRPHLLIHGGLVPDWTASQLLELAGETAATLAGPDGERLLGRALEDPPERWFPELDPESHRAFVLSTLARLRMLAPDGRLADFSGPPDAAPPGLVAWFEHPERRSRDHRIVCGHWAALGLRVNESVVALDSGVVWGERLTAIRLDDGQIWQQETLEETAVSP